MLTRDTPSDLIYTYTNVFNKMKETKGKQKEQK